MAGEIDVRAARLGGLGIGRREAGRLLILANLTYPLTWNAEYLPKHFGNAASTRYQYTPRAGERGSGRKWKGSYTQRKLSGKHHTRPLEHSGAGKSQAMSGRRSTATKGTARAVVPASVFNLRNPKSDVHMRYELLVIIPSETSVLEGRAGQKFEAVYRRAARRHG